MPSVLSANGGRGLRPHDHMLPPVIIAAACGDSTCQLSAVRRTCRTCGPRRRGSAARGCLLLDGRRSGPRTLTFPTRTACSDCTPCDFVVPPAWHNRLACFSRRTRSPTVRRWIRPERIRSVGGHPRELPRGPVHSVPEGQHARARRGRRRAPSLGCRPRGGPDRLSVISPVMPVVGSTVRPLRADTLAAKIATPANGPSFGMAPVGT